jgi:hypothetical protein
MIRFIDKLAPSNRRPLKVDKSSIPTIKPGQIVTEDGTTQFVKLADGDVGDPAWAFVDTTRKDVIAAASGSSGGMTVVDGGFWVAEVDTVGYVGTPAKNDALIIGSTTDKGKLVVQAVSTVAHLKAVVAYCVRAPDADGFMRFKTIR